MAMPRLDALPAELVHQICRYSDKAEIRSLRRVAPALSSVADEYLLDRITIVFESGHMEVAEAIVENPRIAKTIRTLRFKADRVEHLAIFKMWDLQRVLMDGCSPISCIAKILRACPKLDSAVIYMSYYFHLCPDDVCIRNDTTPANETLETLETLGASVQAGRKLKSLTLAPINHYFFDQSAEEELIVIAQEVISGLERIHIMIDNNFDHEQQRELIKKEELKPKDAISGHYDDGSRTGDDAEDEYLSHRESEVDSIDAYEDGRLPHFLSKAPKLRHIQVEGPVAYDIEAALKLRYILGDHHWQNLSILDLARFSTGPRELADFVLSHRNTLKRLALQHIHVYGSWSSVLYRIGGHLPELQSVRVRRYVVDEILGIIDYEEYERHMDLSFKCCLSPQGTETFLHSGDPNDLDPVLRQ